MDDEFLSKRIGRADYFVYVFGPFVLLMISIAVLDIVRIKFQINYGVSVVQAFSFLALLGWFIILSIKRFRDNNLSGWFIIIPMVFSILAGAVTGGFGLYSGLLLVGIILSLKKGNIGVNKFGQEQVSKDRSSIFYWALSIVLGIIVVGFIGSFIRILFGSNNI